MFQEFQVSPTAKSAKQVKDEKLFDTLNCFDGNKKKGKCNSKGVGNKNGPVRCREVPR